MFMVHDGAGGKSRKGETIFADGVRYIMVNDKWSRSRISVEETRQQEKEDQKNAKSHSCHYLRDETVNGETAAVYSVQTEIESAKS